MGAGELLIAVALAAWLVVSVAVTLALGATVRRRELESPPGTMRTPLKRRGVAPYRR